MATSLPDGDARNAIEALRNTPEGQVRLSALRDTEGRILIQVADNGSGIPPDQRGKVFVTFFTTKRQGSCVGLTLARQIATVHGGTVTISETAGGGTTATMRFRRPEHGPPMTAVPISARL